jgi:hypothetical protein
MSAENPAEFPRPVRLVIALAVLAYMMGGPAYRQLAGGTCQLFPEWKLYRNAGIGLADARYDVVLPDGKVRRVPARRFMSQKPPRIMGREGVVQEGRHLQEIVGDNASVLVTARLARPNGWQPLFDRQPVRDIEEAGRP